MLGGLGENYANELRRLYSGRVPGFADLVCYWFEKARESLISSRTQRVGLVATNSISGGENRFVLDSIAKTLRIFLAYSDEAWTVEGADVRVAIVGFGSDQKEQQYLNGRPVTELNADLESGPKLISAARLKENKGVAFEGTKKYGDFEISGELARSWLLEPINVNGRSNTDVLKPWLNGRDFSSRSSGRWIVDFSGLSEQEASLFEAPYQHVLQTVKPTRQSDRNLKTRSIWWRYERERTPLRQKLRQLDRFITTTRHSKFRLFAWTHTCTIPDSALIAITRDDDTSFGILHSRFHEAWSLRLGTWLGVGNDPRYTPSTTFETFPFPEGLQPSVTSNDYQTDPHAQTIAKAAKRLDELRNAWLNPSDLVKTEPEVVPAIPIASCPRMHRPPSR